MKTDCTLNAYSSLTRKGKLTACNILFSFNVCSICLSFTTWQIKRDKVTLPSRFHFRNRDNIKQERQLTVFFFSRYICSVVTRHEQIKVNRSHFKYMEVHILKLLHNSDCCFEAGCQSAVLFQIRIHGLCCTLEPTVDFEQDCQLTSQLCDRLPSQHDDVCAAAALKDSSEKCAATRSKQT